jgi:hypothetical protein
MMVRKNKRHPDFRAFVAGLYGECMGPLAPVLKQNPYILDKIQYLTGEQRIYPISAAAVDKMCRFQDKIRIDVDKIDKIA